MRQLSLRSLTTCVKPSDVCPKRSIPGMRKADAVTGEPPKVRRTISGLIWKAAYPVYAMQLENSGQTPQETGLMICHQKLIGDYMGRFRLVRRKPVAIKA